jgi:hypothetical protein
MASQNRHRFRFWSPVLSAIAQAKAFSRLNRQPYFKFYVVSAALSCHRSPQDVGLMRGFGRQSSQSLSNHSNETLQTPHNRWCGH